MPDTNTPVNIPKSECIVSNFVQKAFRLLETPSLSLIIHWLANGTEFQIVQPEEFQQETLPKYFRHNNVHSFIRQLNMYGFQKSRKSPSKMIFSHPHFLRGRQDLLGLVRRKSKNERLASRQAQQIELYSNNSQHSPISPQLPKDQTELLLKQRTLQKNSFVSQGNKKQVKTSKVFQTFLQMGKQVNQKSEPKDKNMVDLGSRCEMERECGFLFQDCPSMREIGTETLLLSNSHNNDMLSLYDSMDAPLGGLGFLWGMSSWQCLYD